MARQTFLGPPKAIMSASKGQRLEKTTANVSLLLTPFFLSVQKKA